MIIYNTFIISVFLAFFVLATEGNENDFNCPDECGLYSKRDRVGPHLHDGCTAMEESATCAKKFVMEKEEEVGGDKKNKTRKRSNTNKRIVGGKISKNPMPWMVRLFID